ncbi:iron chaperone [Parapedobacter pyrenivorans]|uniref:iron chaperone n=1 Tax=Parapedobacter pyrenivorans TaxID=1305674 RepID=UPI0033403D6B
MAKTDYQTIDEYHQAFGGETLARMQTVRKIINELVPDATESISYQIPCFKYHGYLIYYCAFPKHISLSHPYSEAFWEHFKADLVGYKTSKSVIQIPMDKPLPEALINKIVAFRKKENETKATSNKK